MKDLSGFNAPHIKWDKIRDEADKFRETHSEGKIPVDIEDIIEFKLGIDLQPKSNLYSHCNTDAFLCADCEVIYIDNEDFVNPNKEVYIRFSLAHEIGHFILHKDIVPIIRANNIEEWKQIFRTIPEEQYKWIEQQAYEFAGRLLVPRDRLIQELQLQSKRIAMVYDVSPDIPDEAVINQVSATICRVFNVSDEVVARRIRAEKIWPPQG